VRQFNSPPLGIERTPWVRFPANGANRRVGFARAAT
jgi:hypothetical protein